MPPQKLLPRGLPLTQQAELTDRLGVHWLVYIEGVPPVVTQRWLAQTLLPGRRLRFDSAAESRVSPRLPAGAPFLTDHRLQSLLAESPLLREIVHPALEPYAAALRRRGRAAMRSLQTFGVWLAEHLAEEARALQHAAERLQLGERVAFLRKPR
jgi:hypothetical protein